MLARTFPFKPVIQTSVLAILLTLLQSCAVLDNRIDGPPVQPVDISKIPNPVPKNEPRSRYGNPESYVVNGESYRVLDNSTGFVERGIASWYGRKFQGRRTSSGETYNPYAMTAAHRTLPLPTYVEVTNLRNGKQVIVRVNDRGPFHVNRIIDLSYVAALKLGIVTEGTGLVEIRAIEPGKFQTDGILASSGVNREGKGFYLQVGSFSSYDNALKLRSRLAGLADNLIHISEVTISERKYFRVRFGPITDVKVADRIVIDLNHFGMNENHILIDL